MFEDEGKETDTLLKAQSEKNDVQFKEKTKTMKGSTVFHFYESNWKFKSIKHRTYYIFNLAGCLCTAMLVDTI